VLFNQVLDRDKGNAFSYTDSRGYEPLRQAVCGYLEGYGVKTDAEKIQIISGAQQGVDIVSKALLTTNDVVFVENPTYYGAVGAFLSRGALVIPINMQKDGIDLDRLKGFLKLYKPRFIYVMTYFQTPTCVSYSMAKKRALLDLAAKYDTYIIEEDNQSEFNYGAERVTPLKALDHRNRVIYIKSFSKILMPGLRLGFMALPKKVGQQVAAAKHTSDIYTSGFTQRAFELYLKSDNWQLHTDMMRRTFMDRYEFFIKQADVHLRPYIKYAKPGGGLSLWAELRDKNLSAQDVCARLLEEKVVATPGAVFSADEQDLPFLRLSFADLECEKISAGVKAIARVLAALSEFHRPR
jgi:DNA-binding transcriptional MocR family regulator